jgi:translation initiation factor 3 subunit D
VHFKHELARNHIKLSRWAVQSYLAGVDNIKLAYIARKNLNVNTEHTLYGFQDIQPIKLLQFTNFNEGVGWGMIRQLYDILKEANDGLYVLAKVLHGTNQLVRIYKIKEKQSEATEADDLAK